jgi:hypothetical protein
MLKYRYIHMIKYIIVYIIDLLFVICHYSTFLFNLLLLSIKIMKYNLPSNTDNIYLIS